LFKVQIDEESLLSTLINSCELFLHPEIRDEIIDDIKKGESEFASEEKEREVRDILKNVKVQNFSEVKSYCQEILKDTDIEFRNLKKPDPQCIVLALQLSRHYKLKSICLVTDDGELYRIAKNILEMQFIGKVYSTCHFLTFLCVRGIINLKKCNLLDVIRELKYSEHMQKEIQILKKAIGEKICPYNCTKYGRCVVFSS
jgi:hypothetical protein